MKLLLRVGLVVATIGIVMGGMVLAWNVATSPDRPGEDEPRAFLHFDPVNNSEEVDGPVIEYADLTPEQQAFVERAISDGKSGTPITEDVDHSVWSNYDGVRYENRTYRVSRSES